MFFLHCVAITYLDHLVQDGAIHPERHSRTMRLPSIPERTIKFQRVEIQPGEEPLPTSECQGVVHVPVVSCLAPFSYASVPVSSYSPSMVWPFSPLSIAFSERPISLPALTASAPPNPIPPDLCVQLCPVEFLQKGSLTPGASSACRLGGEDRQPREDLLH